MFDEENNMWTCVIADKWLYLFIFSQSTIDSCIRQTACRQSTIISELEFDTLQQKYIEKQYKLLPK